MNFRYKYKGYYGDRDSDSNSESSGSESEIECNYYSTLGPKPKHWLADYYYYGGEENFHLTRVIDVLYLCMPYLKDNHPYKKDEPIQVIYSFKDGVKHRKSVRVFTSKYEKNVAAAFLFINTGKTRWVESWQGADAKGITDQINKVNEDGLDFFIHVSGFVGTSKRGGFAVIVRDYVGIPILAFHSSASKDDTLKASSLEIEGVYKAFEISKKYNLKQIRIYCTRERVADKIEESLELGREPTGTLKLIRDDFDHFKTCFIDYCGKFRNASARYLARHGRDEGYINAKELHGKLVDLLYKDAAGETGMPFA